VLVENQLRAVKRMLPCGRGSCSSRVNMARAKQRRIQPGRISDILGLPDTSGKCEQGSPSSTSRRISSKTHPRSPANPIAQCASMHGWKKAGESAISWTFLLPKVYLQSSVYGRGRRLRIPRAISRRHSRPRPDRSELGGWLSVSSDLRPFSLSARERPSTRQKKCRSRAYDNLAGTRRTIREATRLTSKALATLPE